MMNQTKQLVALLAFLMAIGLIGYTFFATPTVPEAVLQEQAEAQGEAVYLENCVACHGRSGESFECYAEDGDRLPCMGRPLKSEALLCGSPPQRLQEVGWNGDLENYLVAVTTVGRSENGMPAYGQVYGGTLTEARIALVSGYIVGWQADVICE